MLQRLCSIETGPEEQFVETRHAHVRDTAADLMVRREDGTKASHGALHGSLASLLIDGHAVYRQRYLRDGCEDEIDGKAERRTRRHIWAAAA